MTTFCTVNLPFPMALSSTALTHLVYQLIILTLLFFNNQLLCLAFFCYQLVVLSRCLAMPTSQPRDFGPAPLSRRQTCGISRREKSVINLGASPKYFTHPQRAKSCINLDDAQKLRPTEGSPDDLQEIQLEVLQGQARKGVVKEHFTISAEAADPQELSKSYSFPFRQKRLQSWLEMREDHRSLDVPYWQTVGYSLAVKYEARRRRRATPKKSAIGRIKAGISNLVPKKKRELSHDRPSMFYPKHLPFEKERFESDVRRKMEELGDF